MHLMAGQVNKMRVFKMLGVKPFFRISGSYLWQYDCLCCVDYL